MSTLSLHSLILFIALVNPGKQISSEIEQLTGITNDNLNVADTFAEIAPRLRQFIQDNKGDAEEVILAGYNARDYDIVLLKTELLRLDDQSSLSITDFGDKVMDILHLVRNNDVWDAIQVTPPAQNSLENVHLALCGEPAADLHSARGDVNAMKAVIQRLDPNLSFSLDCYTYPLCYKNVDFSTLHQEERKVAITAQGKSLCFDMNTPLYSFSSTHLLSLCDSSYSLQRGRIGTQCVTIISTTVYPSAKRSSIASTID